MDIDRYQSQPRKQMCSIKEKTSITDFNIKSMLASQLRKSLLEGNHLNSLHFENTICSGTIRASLVVQTVERSACNVGAWGSIPSSGRSPREGNGNLLQYSCLGNPRDREAWRATVHGVPKSRTWLSDIRFHFHFFTGIIKTWYCVIIKEEINGSCSRWRASRQRRDWKSSSPHRGRGCQRRALCSPPESLSLEAAALLLLPTEAPQDSRGPCPSVQRLLRPGLGVQSRQGTCTEPPKRRKFPKGCLGKVHFHTINMYHLPWEADRQVKVLPSKMMTVGYTGATRTKVKAGEQKQGPTQLIRHDHTDRNFSSWAWKAWDKIKKCHVPQGNSTHREQARAEGRLLLPHLLLLSRFSRVRLCATP